jgi:aspartyl-tRNA(Asn)/glutamyl-tRNA(Gln) amidotransferase subunit A
MFLDVMKGYDPQATGYDSMLAPDPDESITTSLDGSIPASATVVVIPSMLRGCQPDVLNNFEAAVTTLAELGCTITELEPLAGFDPNAYAMAGKISSIEKAAYIKELLVQRPGDISPECVEKTKPMLETDAPTYIAALEARAEIERRMEVCLAQFERGFYAVPPMKTVAPTVPKDLAEQDEQRRSSAVADVSNTWLFNASHQPSVSIPSGRGKESGLPTSIMISGALWDDAGVLQMAHAFQCATEYHLARPPL